MTLTVVHGCAIKAIINLVAVPPACHAARDIIAPVITVAIPMANANAPRAQPAIWALRPRALAE